MIKQHDIYNRWGVPLLLLLSAIIFAPTLANGFVWDDLSIVLPITAYREFDLASLLLTPANGLEYLPLRDLTLAIDFALWGEQAWGFHLSNLIYYLISLLLVYRVVRRLAILINEADAQFIAFWCSAIFALHPLHAEAVNFITGRNNILCLLFLLWSFDHILQVFSGRLKHILPAILLFLLALLSKAHAVFFPLFILLLIWLLPAINGRRRLLLLLVLPLFLVDILAIMLHMSIAGETGLVSAEILRFGNQSLLVNLSKAAQLPFFYLEKFLWPHPLSIAYPEPFLHGNHLLRGALCALLLFGALLWAWRIRQRSIVPLVGLIWFLLALGPVSNLIPNTPVVADRYIYPGLLGIALISAWGVRQTSRRWPITIWPALAVLVIWAGLDLKRNAQWQDNRSLFSAAYTVYPDQARDKYAEILFNAGEVEQALALYRDQQVQSHFYYYYLGRQLERQGDMREAAAAYRQSLTLGGDAYQWVYLALAQLQERTGEQLKALENYLRVLEAGGPDPSQRHLRQASEGLARLRAARAAEGSRLEQAVKNAPDSFEAHYALGYFHQTVGLFEQAEAAYSIAAQLAPQRWEPWYNLGLVRGRQGHLEQAYQAFSEVLRRKPGHAQSLNHMAIYMAKRGDITRAIAHYESALQANPGFTQAAFNMGRLYFRLGDKTKSRHWFEQARQLAVDDQAMRARIDNRLKLLE